MSPNLYYDLLNTESYILNKLIIRLTLAYTATEIASFGTYTLNLRTKQNYVTTGTHLSSKLSFTVAPIQTHENAS